MTPKSTKTDRVRVIPLNETALEALRQQEQLQARERKAAGAWNGSGYVFTRRDAGLPYRPFKLPNNYRDVARRARVPTSIHALGHTGITMMVASSADVRSVAEIAGHSLRSTITSLSTYSSPVTESMRRAVLLSDSWLAAANTEERNEQRGQPSEGGLSSSLGKLGSRRPT